MADRGADPKYEEEVSGCTASVGVISRDKIWVVCVCCRATKVSLSDSCLIGQCR